MSDHRPAHPDAEGDRRRPPGSPELTALLDRISVDADVRDRDRIAPYEQIALGQGGRPRPAARAGRRGRRRGDRCASSSRPLIALAEADSNVAHILRMHFWFVEQQLLATRPRGPRARLAIITADELVGNGFSEQSKNAGRACTSTPRSPRTRTAGYRLNGEKFYSTGSLYSDYTQIWASTPTSTHRRRRRSRSTARASRSRTTGTASASASPAPARRGCDDVRRAPRRSSSTSATPTTSPTRLHTAPSCSSTCRP